MVTWLDAMTVERKGVHCVESLESPMAFWTVLPTVGAMVWLLDPSMVALLVVRREKSSAGWMVTWSG